jgi:hypothetical protein
MIVADKADTLSIMSVTRVDDAPQFFAVLEKGIGFIDEKRAPIGLDRPDRAAAVIFAAGSDFGTRAFITRKSVVFPHRFSAEVMARRGEIAEASNAWTWTHHKATAIASFRGSAT